MYAVHDVYYNVVSSMSTCHVFVPCVIANFSPIIIIVHENIRSNHLWSLECKLQVLCKYCIMMGKN